MKKAKIGIIGMGQRCCFHGAKMFSSCEEVATVAAICDNRTDRLEYAKKKYEEFFGYSIKAYLDYKEMYEKEDLDGVLIASPNYLHGNMTIDALNAGIHVLCEKPMEVTLAKADEMIECAKKNNRILALAMQMHYRRRYHKVKEIIQSGTIGKVAQVWCTEYRPPYAAMKEWVWEKEKSGGAIFEKNCHHYDILNLWVQSDPTTVYASGNIMKHETPHGFKSEIIDNAWIVNDYENDVRAMVSICFLASHEQGHYREFGVHGTEGKIFFSHKDNEIIHVQYANGDDEAINMNKQEWMRGGLEVDFVNCILNGGEPLVTPELGRKSLLVPMAAEMSIEEKRVVHVSELK